MKALGYILVVVGFLASSYNTVVQSEGVPVGPFIGTLAIGIIGVILIRIALKREASHEETLAANMSALEESLAKVVTLVDDLDDRKDQVNVYDLRHEIDRLFPDHLDRFVQARQSIAHRYGLQAYADVMNPFSAGERYLNRVWSASTDGYIEEAHNFLDMAREQFDEAGRELARVRGAA
jgi:hypothetical protein